MLGSGDRHAFRSPTRSNAAKILWYVVPPTMQMSAVVTGGLQRLYASIKKPALGVQPSSSSPSSSSSSVQNCCPLSEEAVHGPKLGYTSTQGVFCPSIEMPLMAARYQFLEIIAQGQSSVIIKAKDLCKDGVMVAIKVLHTKYFLIGGQEADILRELNMADVHNLAPVARLQNVFHFDNHYCLVLDCYFSPITHSWSKWTALNHQQKLGAIREVAAKLITMLGFLHKQNVIHADLKPDNILLTSDLVSSPLGMKLSTDLKVIDFGNSIRNIAHEVALYEDDFEMQTLVYRAPEVLLGVSIGPEVDVWSVGCILGELYLSEPMFMGNTKEAIVSKIVDVLGPPPPEYKAGRFFSEFFTELSEPLSVVEIAGKLQDYLQCADFSFTMFLAKLLAYKPEERLTPWEAMTSHFIAPYFPVLLLAPSPSDRDLANEYPRLLISEHEYSAVQGESVQCDKRAQLKLKRLQPEHDVQWDRLKSASFKFRKKCYRRKLDSCKQLICSQLSRDLVRVPAINQKQTNDDIYSANAQQRCISRSVSIP